METDGRELLKAFLMAYFEARSREDVQKLMSGQMICFGTSGQEMATDQKGMERKLVAEFTAMPAPICYRIEEYTEKCCRGVLNMVCVLYIKETECEEEYPIRISAAWRRENLGGGWKILNLYMSKPVGRCQEEKLLTLDFGYRMEADGGSVVSRELLELLSDVCPGGLWGAYLEPGFPLYLINDEMLGYLGYTYQEFVEATGMLVMNNVVPEDRERVEREILEQLQNKKNYELRYRCWTKSGSVLWMFSRGRKVMTSEGRPVIIGMVLDISKDIALHENLRKEAATDALTKIYNRREALKRIELFFEQYQNGTLFIIDIDNFKALNDTYGHPAGDEVLVALAEMLKRSVRCQDVVARLGGDEFLVYFPSMGEQAAICAKAQMLQEKFASLSEKYGISDLHISIGASMHRKGECFEELYRRADEALYKVKHTMKGGFYLEEAPV